MNSVTQTPIEQNKMKEIGGRKVSKKKEIVRISK
jgi:hypothetical protein